MYIVNVITEIKEKKFRSKRSWLLVVEVSLNVLIKRRLNQYAFLIWKIDFDPYDTRSIRTPFRARRANEEEGN